MVVWGGVWASGLPGKLTNTCQNVIASSPQKLIYVALQATWKLLANRLVTRTILVVPEIALVLTWVVLVLLDALPELLETQNVFFLNMFVDFVAKTSFSLEPVFLLFLDRGQYWEA